MRGRCCLVLRLKTRSQFQAVLAGNKLATSPRFAVHHLAGDTRSYCATFIGPHAADTEPSGCANCVWLGAMIPKRWARRAVTRNTIKRQIYTMSRAIESDMPAGAWVVRLRAGFDKIQFRSASSTHLKEAVRVELADLLTRAVRAHASKPLQGLAK